MADTEKTPETPPTPEAPPVPAFSFVAGPPASELRARTINADPAVVASLRELVIDKAAIADGKTTYGTITDGTEYPDPTAASTAPLAKTLKVALSSIAPEGTRAVVRVHPQNGKFLFVVTLAPKGKRAMKTPASGK